MIKTRHHIPLVDLHTFQLPAIGAEVRTLENAADCSMLPTDQYYVLGEGSNTIFTENFSRPLVINRILGIEVTETTDSWHIDVGAGENWHNFVLFCLERHIYGLENLALIPGTVGAAPVQNIGAYGREVREYVASVAAWDRTKQSFVRLAQEECEFDYRDSIFKRSPERWIITSVQFVLPKAWRKEASYGELTRLAEDATAIDIFNQVVAIRRTKLPDPKVNPNAGSFFKNPVLTRYEFEQLSTRYPDMPSYSVANDCIKVPAGWLIDRLDWKGKNCGSIYVHPNQALVLVNGKPGKGQDLLRLARSILDSVKQAYDIQLEVEVRLLGQHDLIEM